MAKRPKEADSPQTAAPPPPDAILKWTHVFYAVIASLIFASVSTHLFVKAPIDATEFSLPDPIELKEDSRLDKVELLLDGQVYGPESIAFHPTENIIYTGMRTGLVCQINLDEEKIENCFSLTNTTECDGSYKSFKKCGRPLGMRYNKKTNELYVVDAYLGIFSVDWEKGKVWQIIRGGEQITDDDNAPPLRYLNDLDILENGMIIMSESSNKFDDRDFILDMLEHRPNGRLIAIDPKTKSVTVLVDGLYFPNGVQIWNGQVLFAEMGMSRVQIYSPKFKKVETLIGGLPGYPDNIRLASAEEIWIPLPAKRIKEDNWIAERPKMRNLLTKLLSVPGINFLLEWIADKEQAIIKFNVKTRQVVDVLRGNQITDISIAIPDTKGNLILGSDVNYCIGKVKL